MFVKSAVNSVSINILKGAIIRCGFCLHVHVDGHITGRA